MLSDRNLCPEEDRTGRGRGRETDEGRPVALSWGMEKGQSEEGTVTAEANAEKEPATPRPGGEGRRQGEQQRGAEGGSPAVTALAPCASASPLGNEGMKCALGLLPPPPQDPSQPR